jgi:hypothetical protein
MKEQKNVTLHRFSSVFSASFYQFYLSTLYQLLPVSCAIYWYISVTGF